MRTVLMAAGMGRRLRAATGNAAKALARVGGKTLLEHQLTTLVRAGFSESDIVVVGGCDFEKVAEIVRRAAPLATLIENPDFHHQNLLSLLAARAYLADGFLLVNVDHLLPYSIHKRMVAVSAAVPFLACVDHDRPLGADDMKVQCDEAGERIVRISKQLEEFDKGYIGVTRVSSVGIPAYLNAADEVLASIGPERAVVEMVLAKLATSHTPPVVCDVSGHRWFEVDTPDELVAAEGGLAAMPDFFEQC